jgi:hypothetical protein
MTFFVTYPQMGEVQDNINVYMQVFNEKMTWFAYLPIAIMLISALGLIKFSPQIFPKWTIYLSLALVLISVICTFFIIIPIHNILPESGLSPQVAVNLLPAVLKFQIVPMAIQALLAIFLLNIYFKETTIFARLLFIVVFGLTMYSWGTFNMESRVGYPMWLHISAADWLATRSVVGVAIPVFLEVFLVPYYLPIPLLILLFWKRPINISKLQVALMFIALLWIFGITAVYFVPKIQNSLGLAHSLALIKDLNAHDFLLRGIVDLCRFGIAGWMFLSIKRS